MAAETYLVRHGRSFVYTADYRPVITDGPDIYATVDRVSLLHVEWEITAGRIGEPLDWGTTLTRWGADLEARAAAHRPGLTTAVTR